MAFFGLFGKEKKEKLDSGLEKTRTGLFSKISRLIFSKSKVDDDVLDELEEILISSDVGVDTTVKIIDMIQERVKTEKYVGTDELNELLRSTIASLLEDGPDMKNPDFTTPDGSPYVIMVVGVNGVGKTTTIGKLANNFKKAGKKVYIGAADTFRAAAIDQLQVWADRVGVHMIRQDMGSDPASVAYDTLASAKKSGADVVLIVFNMIFILSFGLYYSLNEAVT